MHDAHGVLLDAPAQPFTYLHGGYGGLLEALERALEGLLAGAEVRLQLEPEQAFGEYDAELVRLQPAERYGEGLAVGMEIEEDGTIYRVTDLAGGQVVLDANHPLAGMALRFYLKVLDVRAATAEELKLGVSSA
ncbi:MAG TPA: peptidylprolyl isomerase [Burkholderiales bacterium]|nr:peptidylprolyl isomerase [Burkholderiales bacterium]